jgi:hypothetical protein
MEVASSSTLCSDALMKSSLKQLCNPELCPTVCLGFMVPMEMYICHGLSAQNYLLFCLLLFTRVPCDCDLQVLFFCDGFGFME